MKPFSSSESARLDAFRHFNLKRVQHLFRGGLLGAALAFMPSSYAANGPPPGAGATLNVQGVVEVINDTLTQPFRQTRSNPDLVISGTATTPIPFNVPLGKRLVIETVTVFARVSPGQKALVRGVISGTQGGIALIDLALKSQGTFNGLDVFSATAPMTIRVDGTVAADELSFVLERSGNAAPGPAFLTVSVFGYLVDVPAN